ncbi:MAG: hypothetical protein ACYTFY_07000 [Planctomycetota bacterium]|jgi:hypothetical protein
MKIAIIFMVIILAAVIGFGMKENSNSNSAVVNAESEVAASAGNLFPEGLVVDSIKGTPVLPAAAKETAKTGDKVLLVGTIGGRSTPFVKNRAMFILSGKGAAVLADCCPSKAKLSDKVATVQVVDKNGKVIPTSLEGYRGLLPGTTVTVSGTVEQNKEGVFLINATALAILTEEQTKKKPIVCEMK